MVLLSRNKSVVNHRVGFLTILCLLLISMSGGASAAQKWKDITLDESEVKLKNFPSADECRIRSSVAEDYSRNYTVFFCPKRPNSSDPQTYIRVQELIGNRVWGGGYIKDFTQHPIFTKWKNDRRAKYFENPVISPGQRTKCYSDSECHYQRIVFSVKGRDCQYIFYTPDLQNAGAGHKSHAPFAVEIFTCHTATAITKDDIKIKPNSVIINFPGTSHPSKGTDSRTGNSSDNQNSSSSGSNSSNSSDAYIKKIADKALCLSATDANGNWEQEYAYKIFVDEAQSRSLSLETCSELSGRPNPSELRKFDNTQLCNLATRGDELRWQTSGIMQRYVDEAKRRNLTISKCSELTGRPNPEASPPQSSSAKSAGKESDSIEVRLKKLKKLEDAGLITSEEAKAKRKEILKNM